MRNILKHILFFILVSVFLNTAFGDETKLDPEKTISQLSAEIKAINANVLNKLKETDIDLNYFVKNNLNLEEINNLSSIINTYNLNTLSTQESELIENKKNLYSNLTKYINPEKIEEYKTFITNDANKIKQSIFTKEAINTKTEIINEKIEAAKEKIAENNEIIKERIALKIDQKLSLFKKNKDFVKLNTELKEKVVDGIITKADDYIKRLEKLQNKTNTLLRKIETYELLKNKLEQFKNSL